MITPERLHKNDTVGVIALASPPDLINLEKGIYLLEEMGLKVKLGKHIANIDGYLAGTDAERLADFHEMIADTEIKAIIFACGGYGSGRLAQSLNYELIRNNPKIIWGYSDMTYLHTAIRQIAGLITFHGPMVASDLGKGDIDDLTMQLFGQLFTPMFLNYTETVAPIEVLTAGNARGVLVGGNLSLLTSTIGTPFEIDTNEKIVLIEDVGEQPYQIDAMLQQLLYAGKLKDAAGIIIGDFAKAEPAKLPSLSLATIFETYVGDLNIPVMKGFKIGHTVPNFSLPFGTEAILCTKKKTLRISPGVY